MKRPALKPDMRLGAEPKKVVILVSLLAVGGIVYYINSSDSPSGGPSSTPVRVQSPAAPAVINTVRPPSPRQNISRSRAGIARGSGSLQEFKPTLKPKDGVDPAKIDPILKLAMLEHLRKVGVEASGRSLFDFATGPPPAPAAEVAKVKPIHPGGKPFIGPIDTKGVQERAAAAAAAPKPPPPPIPLKFYGFTNLVRQGHKRAFFLEGDDIFVAGEGDVIKNRYKVVRIGINSAVVEDTSNQHQQTLPLEAEGVAS